jgi:hypothetical protein
MVCVSVCQGIPRVLARPKAKTTERSALGPPIGPRAIESAGGTPSDDRQAEAEAVARRPR